MLSASLTFMMTAAVVYFLMILPMNRYKERRAAKAPVAATPAEVTEIELLGEIRDALVAQRNGYGPAARPGGPDTNPGSGSDRVPRQH